MAEKGYTLKDFAQVVRELGEQEELVSKNDVVANDQELHKRVTRMIREIGIPANFKGYHYVRSAICEAAKDYTVMNNMTQKLYTTVAKKFDTTTSRVERGIRHVIEVAWCRGNFEAIQQYFGHDRINYEGKPTNTEFIAILADYIICDL